LVKKGLYRILVAVGLTLIVLVGWQGQSVQITRAVEIQPGSSRQPENTSQATSAQDPAAATGVDNLPTREAFIHQVWDGQAGSLRGLYVPGLLALRVVQQPDGLIDFISYDEGSATEYQSPRLFGVIGLLAHNFLSGRFFLQILPGQNATLIYGDGQTAEYQVTEIRDYERLTEQDMHSDFRDLETGQIISADQVFRTHYKGAGRLTLQTCLENDGNWNWGIRMITALPVHPAP
jgi:hypothetical protein